MDRRVDLVVIGAGILGLAHAWAAAKRGLRVAVFDRSPAASGASVRNFGMIWPIGQPHGEMLQLSLRSRDLWRELLELARLPCYTTGSLHLAYADDEAEVAREFAEAGPALGYDVVWLSSGRALQRSGAIAADGLRGALWSATEMTVDPRLTLAALPVYLHECYGVEFHFSCAVTAIELPRLIAGGEEWQADRAIVCAGDDFETLFPDLYANSGLTRVKLQMLRTPPQPAGWQLGPALAAGLTLRFYPSFSFCASLPALRERIAAETPEYDRWGIHGLVSQTAAGELTLGDSHEYGIAVDIFNKEEIDALILRYIAGFLRAPDLTIAQRWHGVYAKHPVHPYLSLEAGPGVRVVTSPGGSGMTLSMGIGEQTINGMER